MICEIIGDGFLPENNCRCCCIFNAPRAIHISSLGKEYYKMYNIYGVQLHMTSSCIITIVNRLIFNFSQHCLEMFFSNDSSAFLAILFLNYALNNVFPRMNVLSLCLWFCIFNSRNVKIAFGIESTWDFEKSLSSHLMPCICLAMSLSIFFKTVG